MMHFALRMIVHLIILMAFGFTAVSVWSAPATTQTSKASYASESRRPNIIFILADDLGWGDLGCYGNTQIKTPNLDRLASQGTRFTQFYVNGSVCSPSRVAFMTGNFPAHHRVHGHFAELEMNTEHGMPNFLDPAVTTLPKLLQKAGYTTAHFGKWHLSSWEDASSPTPGWYGFDEWRITDPGWDHRIFIGKLEMRARSSELIVDETIRFIIENRNNPFYVNTWLLDPHNPLHPPHNSPGVSYKAAAQIYYAVVTEMDRHIGRLMQKIEELGIAENTVVVFSSDNGPEDIGIISAGHGRRVVSTGHGSTGPFRGRKRSLYEGGVRVPFILRYPAATPSGHVDNTTVITAVDFLPTIAHITGIKLQRDQDLDGEDKSAALGGRPVERMKPIMWEWRFRIRGPMINRSPILAIRNGRWKLLMNPDRSRIELYDIPADPSELNNLTGQQPEVVKKLSEQVLTWQATLPKGPIDKGAGSNAYPWLEVLSRHKISILIMIMSFLVLIVVFSYYLSRRLLKNRYEIEQDANVHIKDR